MQEKRLSNSEIVGILKEVLAAMEIKNVNRFRIRAYQNAISILDNLTTSIQDIWEEGRLGEIPGIGESLAGHLNDLFTKGVVREFNEVKKGLPEGMFALLGIRGIGAKKAFKLAEHFGLHSRDDAIDKLRIHAEKQEIRNIEGFGEKSEKDIHEAIEQSKKNKNDKPRMLLFKAEMIVNRIISYMKQNKNVLKIEALGSYRRRNPTIGDLDFVAATNNPESVIQHFTSFPEVGEVLTKGEKKAFVVLKNDVQADLIACAPEYYGSMLQYNTGSKQHNILLRTYALKKGMSLSEYGIKRNEKQITFEKEEDFYKELRIPWIPPELRQGTDEIELARQDKLPALIQLKDIKGDLQSHTTFSDGADSLEDMVAAAELLGYEYFGISDHAPSVQNRGYAEVERMLEQQREKVDSINRQGRKIKVLFGLEVNILADSTLAVPDELLAITDYSIGAIHTAFNQDRDTITGRLIKAIENSYISFIAHPTGRLINERNACDINWEKVFDALTSNKKAIEINAQPNRLDLTEDLVRSACKKGVKFIINSDAHSAEQLSYMKYGIDTARRGFLEKSGCINTLSYTDFMNVIKSNKLNI